jgi:hypothetical protein
MGDKYVRYECVNFGNSLGKSYVLALLKSPKFFKENDSVHIFTSFKNP